VKQVYKSQQSANAQNAKDTNKKTQSENKNDNVVDADFEEVKEDKTKIKTRKESLRPTNNDCLKSLYGKKRLL
jgi:hypothetical protein